MLSNLGLNYPVKALNPNSKKVGISLSEGQSYTVLDRLKVLVSWKVGKDDKTTKRQKDSDDKTTKRQNDKKTVTLFLRAPLVAIGAQKVEQLLILGSF